LLLDEDQAKPQMPQAPHAEEVDSRSFSLAVFKRSTTESLTPHFSGSLSNIFIISSV
jgi:hypothetical protein